MGVQSILFDSRVSSCILIHGGHDEKNLCFMDRDIPVGRLCILVVYPAPTLPPTMETPNILPEPTDHTQLITVPQYERTR